MVASVLDQQSCSCFCTNRCSGRRKGTLRDGLADKYSVFHPTEDQQSHAGRSSATVSTMFFGANLGSTNSLKIKITHRLIKKNKNDNQKLCQCPHHVFIFTKFSFNKKLLSHLFSYFQI